MNDDNWYQDSDDAEPTYREGKSNRDDGGPVAPKRGMSTGVKVLIGFLIAGGVMALICCGGMLYFGFQIAQMATKDPLEIRAIQEKIADIDVPDELSPNFGVEGEMFGIGGQMAAFGDDETALLLMQMQGPAGMDAEQMRQEFEKRLDQQGQSRNITVESTEQREVTIAGEETSIEIVKGKDREGKEMRQVKGVFQGRSGAAFVIYVCPEEDWDEERVVEIIESIQTE